MSKGGSGLEVHGGIFESAFQEAEVGGVPGFGMQQESGDVFFQRHAGGLQGAHGATALRAARQIAKGTVSAFASAMATEPSKILTFMRELRPAFGLDGPPIRFPWPAAF